MVVSGPGTEHRASTHSVKQMVDVRTASVLIGQASRAISETEPEQRSELVVSVHVNVGDFSLGDCQDLSILRVAVPVYKQMYCPLESFCF